MAGVAGGRSVWRRVEKDVEGSAACTAVGKKTGCKRWTWSALRGKKAGRCETIAVDCER